MVKVANVKLDIYYTIKKRGEYMVRVFFFCVEVLLVISWKEKKCSFNQKLEYKLLEDTEPVS